MYHYIRGIDDSSDSCGRDMLTSSDQHHSVCDCPLYLHQGNQTRDAVVQGRIEGDLLPTRHPPSCGLPSSMFKTHHGLDTKAQGPPIFLIHGPLLASHTMKVRFPSDKVLLLQYTASKLLIAFRPTSWSVQQFLGKDNSACIAVPRGRTRCWALQRATPKGPIICSDVSSSPGRQTRPPLVGETLGNLLLLSPFRSHL